MGNTKDFDGTSEGIGGTMEGNEDDNPIDLGDNDFSFTPAQTSSARGVSSTKRKRQSIDTCEPITEDSLRGAAMMLSEKLESSTETAFELKQPGLGLQDEEVPMPRVLPEVSQLGPIDINGKYTPRRREGEKGSNGDEERRALKSRRRWRARPKGRNGVEEQKAMESAAEEKKEREPATCGGAAARRSSRRRLRGCDGDGCGGVPGDVLAAADRDGFGGPHGDIFAAADSDDCFLLAATAMSFLLRRLRQTALCFGNGRGKTL
nr:uncharacterized protein At2g29880-like isoform X1 [Ipomoea batatas]